ncbi:MAG: NAD(P)H-hydrate dehydratase [Candidatus Methanodesulfokora washburnensis]|jgi:hydroxyethylthiazole kinase-like uncharacterized protein yjeF
MKVCTVEEIRRIDSRAAEDYGIGYDLLMENAGNALYFVILREIGVSKKTFTVIAGQGNNGGDALVVARKLHSNSAKVRVFILGDPEKYRDPARKNYGIVKKMGIELYVIRGDDELNLLRSSLRESDGVVVGIFGTGLSREITGIHRSVIEEVNKCGKIIFSVDIPSGIGGDDGKVYGVAVKSNYTVTFGLPKVGNLLYPGYDYCGKLYVSHISYPPELYNDIKIEINEPVQPPPRVRWGHKGTFGKLLTVAGAKNYYGAPMLSSLSFLKAGGGYSRLAAPESIIPFIASRASEVVYIPLKETEEGSISRENEGKILELSKEQDIMIIGPGTSLNKETQELMRNLARKLEKPVIIDGDGLTAISMDLSSIKGRKNPTVLTPHLGEMARLTGKRIEEVQNNIDLLRKACEDLNAYIVLKGAHSLIGYPDGRVYINMSGNPGMATAGSGDVLTGTIAALYCLGLEIGDAVRTGVFVHGLAGDIAAEKIGEDGMTSVDIMNYLPDAMRMLRSDLSKIMRRYMPEVI